ncbi:CGNR zinc finger domain-containing protein [Actinoallomurus sp. CA-142502]|uniref:CGNR zinc finger domain-containing protein n=1 Tax=Actinoallomurus sp. CA-142502 TaxID=3239885 RepID=UPI003D8CBC2A
MDLASYADLAVRLVNTQTAEGDRLGDLDALRDLLTAGPHLSGRVGKPDLEAMVQLRADLRSIFESVTAGDEDGAAEGINSLLLQHPVHPQISAHDGQRWHLHITESGSIPDRYAAGAAMGLAVYVSAEGLDRLAICHAKPCRNVFIDTSSNRSRRYCSDQCAGRAEAGVRAVSQGGPSRSDGFGQ